MVLGVRMETCLYRGHIQPAAPGLTSPRWELRSSLQVSTMGQGQGLMHLLSVPQCAPGGCLMELCIQLSIIMLGKQLIQNNLFEIGIP